MSNSNNYLWKMLVFVVAMAAPVSVVTFFLYSGEGFAFEDYWMILAAAILPALILYARLVREMQAVAFRMERAAIMSPLEGDDPTGLRTGLLPLDNLLLTMQQYRRVLQHMLREAQSRQDEAALLFDMLPDPVLVLGNRRRIRRSNAAANRFFNVPEMEGDLTRFLRHPALLKAVDAAYAGSDSGTRIEFTISDVVPRHVAAYIVNLKGESSEGHRLILTLHDLTESRRMQQMRVDFVANASHELRTPLAILIGALETLMGPARNDLEAHQRFFTMMQAQSLRMSQLIDDLLSLSQIEINEHSRPSDRVDLGQVLQGVINLLTAKSSELGKSIALQMPEDKVFVTGDFDQLTQIFTNLIDNALKYSREESEIRVEIAVAAREARATVIDEGEGIPEEHLARLTERFYRVDSDRSRKLGGTGLGLAIVKHIVSRHRGHLEIDSVVGKGSKFSVRLPLSGS
ncbi:GHKL domain-containing protein [Sneathiella sp. CAU 1612]|uniref:histidine kinase n=1 Tax=Sneathiella sedimenti TaxID=2816034 RepID=A0ABS3F5C3_9PROT|nr:ATP-binding protein [Sneathiella sedimenti]MBO0333670.1 GHKL domain-containing protein [Sneathiella sedimenti]